MPIIKLAFREKASPLAFLVTFWRMCDLAQHMLTKTGVQKNLMEIHPGDVLEANWKPIGRNTCGKKKKSYCCFFQGRFTKKIVETPALLRGR